MARSAIHGVFVIVLIFGGCAFVSTASAQPSGAWQAYTWQLWRIDVDGTNLKSLDSTPGDRCGSPDWSPDGKTITYDVLSDSGGGYRIAVIRADGSGRRIIGRGSIPTWSPDGKLIACQASGIYVMNPDGSGGETLPGPAFSLRWSPRGDAILSGIGHQIFSFELATGMSRVLCTNRSRISHGYGISADGSRIAYGTPDNGLWVATIDPQTNAVASRRAVADGTVYHVSWAPDGKHVVFAWQPKFGDLTQIYTVDVDGTAEPQLFPGIDVRVHNVNPDWSSDGKLIVFSRAGSMLESH